MNTKLKYQNIFDTMTEMILNRTKLDGHHSPILFLYKNNNVKICSIILENQSPMDAVKPMVYKEDPDAYIFVGEAWMKKFSINEELPKKWGDITKSDNKKEVLMITYGTKDNSIQKIRSWDIIKENGKINELIEIKNDGIKSEKLP